ncbi:hypothetical protein SOVF_078650 [Spinacia oleracea]|uniref:SET domain-containing protein n=1 Tax=Spinacia oleracea TaxID=3562 RepID=A0A9R0HTM3_SPIOL|nr:uncharacterized protein LOC110776362 [Spinacia oleracea]KNA17607.1 hypothetical protein SOVF_078650 [Spinacia oleracea]
MVTEAETKLQLFLQWLQVNGVELRGCNIKYCDSSKGFGLFSSINVPDGVLLVVPLDLAITPMRVLQDPLVGPPCRAMLEEGEVDDRFLIILFLTVERLRSNSTWKPYLDMIPSSFGNPLWFTEDEFQELKGTTVYRASTLQKKSLQAIFEEKVKDLVKKLLIMNGDSEREVAFEDFLWANSVFWTRALNIPLPRTYVFPEGSEIPAVDSISNGVNITSMEGETLWVEGLVPGIDFCNHAIKAATTWEVDSTGSTSGVPLSMYLLSVNQGPSNIQKEITISYGNKGNEELLYLYGFVIEDNPDDFLMVHYPTEALQSVSFSDSKTQLLQAQKSELRCLLPKSLLDRGFFPNSSSESKNVQECAKDKGPNYSWSGQRKTPSYVNKLVFPEDFLTSLRTVSMQEKELFNVQSLLEELVGTEGEREPSDAEVRAAVWEACGDSGALQLLVDLLNTKLIDLEEGSGTEESDSKLLDKTCIRDSPAFSISLSNAESSTVEVMSKNRWASIVYRRGQKQLTRMFLREAEHALQLCLKEEC